MKKIFILLPLVFALQSAQATVHTVLVWNGYFQFLPAQLTIELGDTIQWLPLDPPTMVHTITSSNIPEGAEAFDQVWQAPVDTFFQYIPQLPGVYDYVCTPHISLGMIATFTVENTATSTSEASFLEEELVIYPNPTTDFIQLKNSNISQSYRIYDANGKIISLGKITDQVDVSSLITGLYFFEIVSDRPRLVKFLKQ